MTADDGLLTFEDGQVTLGGVLIPGEFKGQSVRGSVRFDQAKRDGESGKVKTPMGWEDADISLQVELLSEAGSTCYDKLTELNALFKGVDNGGNPKVYSVVNAHYLARGVSQVVFAGLNSTETDQDDVIACTLNFIEHMPAVVKKEEQVIASDQAEGASQISTPAADAEPAPDDKIMVDVG